MSYISLSRKFRPQNFNEIVGQEHISKILKNAIIYERISPAYLFSGPRGCGKTTMARIFSKALNCKSEHTIISCGICKNCIEISKSMSIDVLEIDGASNNGIDEMRSLIENVKFSSVSSKYKIYIIDESHQITTQAFNALLKTFEEPPYHVVFILVTTEQHKIPVTVLSRCQKHIFRFISRKEMVEAIKKIVKKEGFEIDDEALNIIITYSDGSMRDALNLLDQAMTSNNKKVSGKYLKWLIGFIPKDIIVSIINNIAKRNIEGIFKIVKEIHEQGYDLLQFVKDLRDYLRQVLIYSINPVLLESSFEEKKDLDAHKKLFTVDNHIRMNNLLSKALAEMRCYDQPKIVLETHLIKMAEPYYNVEELMDKVMDLKKSIKNINDNCNYTSLKNLSDKQLLIHNTENNTMQDENYVINTLDMWNKIVCEIIKKHPLTAQSLNKISVRIINNLSIEITIKKQFDYDCVMKFQPQILKLFYEKTNLNLSVKIIFEKDIILSPIERKKQNFSNAKKNQCIDDYYNANKDFKKTYETKIPKHIEEIAKVFGTVAKKI
ncbi:MAG: DNA polymerase III subunit gamma/tau [Endomicrobium sp.]|jgi:DNA polymerase-3 subunit gamma/tau|nr:DNA polymerase III subunit gamma/tau [Endomicrobium sp.]